VCVRNCVCVRDVSIVREKRLRAHYAEDTIGWCRKDIIERRVEQTGAVRGSKMTILEKPGKEGQRLRRVPPSE